MVDKTLQKTIRELIIKGIQRNGDRIFNRSQDTASCFVPVDTGILKASGNTIPKENGVRLQYLADYASKVEFGRESPIPITGKQRVYVPTHRKKNGTVVTGHYKEYNGKLVGWRPKISKFEKGPKIWRVLKEEPAMKGQFFLTRAIHRELPMLTEDIAFYLNSLGKATSRRK